MKHIYLLFLLSCVFFSVHAQTYNLQHDGVERTYIVHLPTGYSPGNSYPLVLNFHGLTGTAEQQQLYTGMDAVADAEGFIIVYPQGLPGTSGQNTWNVGFGSEADDLGFINTLLDVLINDYSVDTDRIYSTGFSMGGFFSYYLACNLGSRFAAIAPVAGLTSTFSCNSAETIPVLHIHGTEDDVVPYEGASMGVEQTITFWTGKNNCNLSPDSSRFQDVNTTDNLTADAFKYTECDAGNQVWLYRINGLGHVWPGAGFGETGDLDASQEIWEFFSLFTLSGVVASVSGNENDIFWIYPNPASDRVYISGNTGIGFYSISDLSGKTIVDEKMLTGDFLEVGNLRKGLYLLKAKNSGNREFVKLLIKE